MYDSAKGEYARVWGLLRVEGCQRTHISLQACMCFLACDCMHTHKHVGAHYVRGHAHVSNSTRAYGCTDLSYDSSGGGSGWCVYTYTEVHITAPQVMHEDASRDQAELATYRGLQDSPASASARPNTRRLKSGDGALSLKASLSLSREASRQPRWGALRWRDVSSMAPRRGCTLSSPSLLPAARSLPFFPDPQDRMLGGRRDWECCKGGCEELR